MNQFVKISFPAFPAFGFAVFNENAKEKFKI